MNGDKDAPNMALYSFDFDSEQLRPEDVSDMIALRDQSGVSFIEAKQLVLESKR